MQRSTVSKGWDHNTSRRDAAAIPMRGTASLVLGMTDETMFMNTVRERRIVTPETITDVQSAGLA